LRFVVHRSEIARTDALRRALEEFHGLGAQPAAAIVARRLRKRGARGLPRGPSLATRRNPAGLTRREAEVLALVADGLRNAEIATRLVLSERTVDHRVSAILRSSSASIPLILRLVGYGGTPV
jgi:DNA-binding NarL/FixJ family response regulator